MSDVFTSYSEEDARAAQVLVQALEQEGFTVWWSKRIPPGRTWEEVIGKELTAAKCVIVLWSHTSVKSNWVKDEADSASARGVLVPVLIDDAQAPLGFRQVEAAKLAGWDGDTSDQEFRQLRDAVSMLVGSPGGQTEAVAAPVSEPDADGAASPETEPRPGAARSGPPSRRASDARRFTAASTTTPRPHSAGRTALRLAVSIVSGIVLLVAVTLFMNLTLAKNFVTNSTLAVPTALAFAAAALLGERATRCARAGFLRTALWPLAGCLLGLSVPLLGAPLGGVLALIVREAFLTHQAKTALT